MKPVFLFGILIFTLLITGCEETIETIILVDHIALDEGTTATLNVEAGNPPYWIETSDKTIATAAVNGSTITVAGVKEGKTTLLLTDKEDQSKNIQVTVGIAPVEFTGQYSSETMKTVLNDFGVSLEEINDPAFDDISILIKPEEADQLKYFLAYEWPLFTSADIKKSINGDAPAIGDEGLRLRASTESLFHHYFIVDYNGNYYLFHISGIQKNINSEGETITTVTGEYKKAR